MKYHSAQPVPPRRRQWRFNSPARDRSERLRQRPTAICAICIPGLGATYASFASKCSNLR